MLKFVLLILLIISFAISGEDYWSSNGPSGGMVRYLAIDQDSPSTIYAAVNRTVYKTTDSGNTWIFAGSGISTRGNAEQVLIDRTNPSIVFVATGDSLFKSFDGGANWQCKNNGINSRYAQSIAMDPANHFVLYCGTRDAGIFKSINGGENWVLSNNGITESFIYSIAIHPDSSNIVYAATAAGVFKSIDSGVNWSPSGANGPTRSLQIDPMTPNTIYGGGNNGVIKSTDGGVNWFDSGLSALAVWNITIDPSSSSVLYAGTVNEDGLYKSTDAGANWNQIGLEVPNPHLNFIAVDPNSSSTLYLATLGNGVYKSIDGGDSFSFSSQGLIYDNVQRGNTIAVDPTDSNTVYATARWGVFKSTNGGDTWSNSIFSHGTQAMGGITIDPFNPQNLFLCYGVKGGSNPALYKSTDGGSTWFGSSDGIMGGAGVSCVTPILCENNCFYANAGKILPPYSDTMMLYKTPDGGNSWIATGLCRNICAIAPHPTDPNIAYIAARNRISAITGGIYKTTNGGSSWFRISSDIPNNLFLSLVMDPVNPEVLYTGMEGWRDDEVYKTTNGGTAWFSSSNGLPSDGKINCLAIDPESPENLYAGLGWEDGVYRSTDAGANWFAINDSLPPLSYLDVNALSVAPQSSNIIFCGLEGRADQGGGVWKYTVGSSSRSETEKKHSFVLSVHPNPAKSDMAIYLTKVIDLAQSDNVSLRVYDTSGRLIRDLTKPLKSSLQSDAFIKWDGKNKKNRRVPTGLYFVRFESNGFVAFCKVILIQ